METLIENLSDLSWNLHTYIVVRVVYMKMTKLIQFQVVGQWYRVEINVTIKYLCC